LSGFDQACHRAQGVTLWHSPFWHLELFKEDFSDFVIHFRKAVLEMSSSNPVQPLKQYLEREKDGSVDSATVAYMLLFLSV
jgi:hypothetical protein